MAVFVKGGVGPIVGLDIGWNVNCAYFIYRRNAFKVFPPLRIHPSLFRPARLREVTGFSVYASIIDWANKLNYQMDQVIIGVFLGSPAVAVWAPAERIISGVQRMDELLEGLLNLAQVSRAKLQREDVDLSGIAQTLAQELADGAVETGVEHAVRAGGGRRLEAALLVEGPRPGVELVDPEPGLLERRRDRPPIPAEVYAIGSDRDGVFSVWKQVTTGEGGRVVGPGPAEQAEVLAGADVLGRQVLRRHHHGEGRRDEEQELEEEPEPVDGDEAARDVLLYAGVAQRAEIRVHHRVAAHLEPQLDEITHLAVPPLGALAIDAAIADRATSCIDRPSRRAASRRASGSSSIPRGRSRNATTDCRWRARPASPASRSNRAFP